MIRPYGTEMKQCRRHDRLLSQPFNGWIQECFIVLENAVGMADIVAAGETLSLQ